MGRARDFRPDVIVNLGDWFEGVFQSRHDRDQRHSWDIQTEFDHVARQATQLNDEFPNAHKVWIYGNHDSNMLNYNPGRRDKDTVALIQKLKQHELDPLLSGWAVYDSYTHKECYYLGQVCFRHGFEVSKAGITKDLLDYTPSQGLMVSGHTHRPEEVTQWIANGVKGDRWYANTGTLADYEQMHYMDRLRRTQWGAGILLAECQADGLHAGPMCRRKPHWEARVEVFNMASGNHHDVSLKEF